MPKRKLVKSSEDSSEDKLEIKVEKKSQSANRLQQSFYNKSGSDLAKCLLGKNLVRVHNGERIAGMIVETEAYLGIEDKAAHSYNGKRTEKTEAMFMKPGTAYVYHIYGLYCCMNISSQGDGCAVLLRAVEPKEGTDTMNLLRFKNKEEKPKPSLKTGKTKLTKKQKDLSNGPAKLCQALDIKKADINKVDLTTSDDIWLEEGQDITGPEIVTSTRININYAEEWAKKPLRYYVLNNPFVSVIDKKTEELITKQ